MDHSTARGGCDAPGQAVNGTASSLGARVAVFRLLPAPAIEGWASIVGPALGEHCFLVRFAGDPIVHKRFIHPDWQTDPERALRLLQQFWRAEMRPAVADFYPEDFVT